MWHSLLFMSSNKLQLEGERLMLRRHRISDVSDIVKNINDKKISVWMLHVPYPYLKKDAVKFM